MAIFRNLCVRLIPLCGTQNTQCIPVVKIFAFLDLAINFSFSDSLLVEKFFEVICIGYRDLARVLLAYIGCRLLIHGTHLSYKG